MLTSLRIQNYKCFADESLEMRSMSIFCGQNGGGKSTAVQAMLLLRETARVCGNPQFVQLNGPFLLELGTVTDVLKHDADGSFIELGAGDSESGDFYSRFDAGPKYVDEQFLSVKYLSGEFPHYLLAEECGVFNYLCAERLGPRDTQSFQSKPKENLSIGNQGEYTAEVLIRCERDTVREELRHPSFDYSDKAGGLLGKQLEFWMRELAPGIEIRTQQFPDTNTACLRVKSGGAEAEWLRPANMGFGISHSLPIFLAGLLSRPGGLLIVDSPESHLHPAGQSALARFLGIVAASGTQVILETHSDHIINGIRLACVDKHPLGSEKVIIHNFYKEEGGQVKAVPIQVTQKGALTSWPKGFFDQSERDLAAIVKARKRDE